MKAKDIMSVHVIRLNPGNSVAHAAQIMIDNEVSGLPVLDDDGKLIGIVTEGDLMRRMELGHRAPADISTAGASEDFVRSHSWRVDDVMTKPAITVDEETPVEDVARIFTTRKIKRVPVVRDGQLVGVVSRTDLLGLIARNTPPSIAAGDEALCISILARLREALPAVTPPTVTIVDGAVQLDGIFQNDNERRAMRVIIDSIPGASVVHDRMQPAQGDKG